MCILAIFQLSIFILSFDNDIGEFHYFHKNYTDLQKKLFFFALSFMINLEMTDVLPCLYCPRWRETVS